MRKDEMVEIVAAGLSAFLGPTMASASARMHSEKLNLGSEVTTTEIEALLSRLEGGLHVFLGRDTTNRALGDIRKALEGAQR